MKTLLLGLDEPEPAPAADCAALGLTSTAPAHQVAWWLNQVLGVRLRRLPDLVLAVRPPGARTDAPRGRLLAARFGFDDVPAHAGLRLLRNRPLPESAGAGRAWVVPELAGLDFLLLLTGAWARADLSPWLARLRAVPLLHYVCACDLTAVRGGGLSELVA